MAKDLLNTGAKDVATHLHSYTNLAALPQTPPLVIVGGDGIHVVDDQGKRYVEGMSGLWCASLGFSNQRLAAAGARALQTLPYYHTFNQRTNVAVADLAEKLLALAPVPMARVFFANSGSEANDSAVKMVWYYHNAIGQPAKKKVIARRNAYHGVTVAAASLGGLDGNHRDFDLPIATAPAARFLHVDCPHHYRYAHDGESEQDFSTRLARQLEDRILAEGPDTVAAFIAEPVMGAGGVLVPPAGYFEKVQAVLRKYDVLLIADEVICGFGRTGNMFGSTTFGLQPDILCCAKALSSGYVPISAVMVNDKVHGAIAAHSGKLGSFGHGYTYSGHPVACAVALETLQVYEDERLIDHVRDLAPAFQAGIRSFAGRPWVGNVRGVGLIGAIELMADKAPRTPFAADRKAGYRFAALALEEGLIVRAMGDSIGLCPPLIITADEMADLFARFARAMDRFDAEMEGQP
ncbi:aminotransferase [Acidovorax sp. NCPPB 3859]|nr:MULTISPECIES: aminotransferase [unclassified Acidovorax]MDA8450513.1 aminotransferase [Acidovorax sp. GBBC 3297]MDA8459813.1 aminotransferase [Acidovorax sp. GBBC 3333]MDA8464849.1 aminotransferase [Acidovorax sp. GBBC 3332]MDA8470028.1 aminotransferase [Acidovorax sp. GBBC 3299]WCM77379.1 aminotransferase [Acidovorax sp. GBBC 712]